MPYFALISYSKLTVHEFGTNCVPYSGWLIPDGLSYFSWTYCEDLTKHSQEDFFLMFLISKSVHKNNIWSQYQTNLIHRTVWARTIAEILPSLAGWTIFLITRNFSFQIKHGREITTACDLHQSNHHCAFLGIDVERKSGNMLVWGLIMKTAKRMLINDIMLVTSQMGGISQYHQLPSVMDILF